MLEEERVSILPTLYVAVTVAHLSLTITGLMASVQLLLGLMMIFIIIPHVSLALLIPEALEERDGSSPAFETRKRILFVSLTFPIIILGSIGLLLGIIGRADSASYQFALTLAMVGTIVLRKESIQMVPRIREMWGKIHGIRIGNSRGNGLFGWEKMIVSIVGILLIATIIDGFGRDGGGAILYIVSEDGGFEELAGEVPIGESVSIVAHITSGNNMEVEKSEIEGILERFADENRTELLESVKIGNYTIEDGVAKSDYRFSFQIEERGNYTFSARVFDSEDGEVFLSVSHKFKVAD